MGNRPTLPRRGLRYATTDGLDPTMLPDHRPYPMSAVVNSARAARPRRSIQKGDDGYFYWCLVCETCLNGRPAFCPAHKREYDRLKKARTRERDRDDMRLSKTQIRQIRDLATRVQDARENLIDALGTQDHPKHEEYFLTVSRRLILAVRRLPEPPE